jgi:hypothetical protein
MVVFPPLLPPDTDGEVEVYEIVEKFVRNFSNGDYDTEFNDALICPDRSVPLPAPARPTQASYNKPDDWVERNRIGLTKLKRQLQTCIDSARHSTRFIALVGSDRENIVCFARQGFSTEISCKCSRDTNTGCAGIFSTSIEYSVLYNAMVEYANALLILSFLCV